MNDKTRFFPSIVIVPLFACECIISYERLLVFLAYARTILHIELGQAHHDTWLDPLCPTYVSYMRASECQDTGSYQEQGARKITGTNWASLAR